MYDPAYAAIDAMLRVEHAIWRSQRLDGADRTTKRHTLDRIDILLDQRTAHLAQRPQQTAAVA